MLQKVFSSQRNTILLIVAITAVCYSTLYKNEFVTFDDGVLIRRHFLVSSEKTQPDWYFRYNFKNPHYKPLVFLSWRAEYLLFGDNPVPFHLNNFLLHLLNSLLVFFIAIALFAKFNIPPDKQRIWAFVFSVVFAIHPMHVESVAWATERKDVLYSAFFLAGWLSYIKHLETAKTKFLVFAVFAYVFTLMSKSMGITLVAVLVLTNWLYSPKMPAKSWMKILPFFVIFVLALFVYGMFSNFSENAAGLTNQNIIGANSADELFAGYPTLFKRAIFISFRMVLWILHTLIPVALSVMYPREQFLEFFGKTILLFPVLIAALLFLAWKWRKKNIMFVFGVLLFFVAISPAVAINEKGSGVFLPDRYTYLPSLGIYLALMGLILQSKIKAKSIQVLTVVYLLFFGIQTIKQVKVWETSENLWNNTVKYFPDFPNALNSRGFYYMKAGEKQKALRDFNKALKNNRSFLGAYNNRCNLLFSMGKYNEALADVNILLLAKPDHVKYITTKAGILFKLNRTDEAIEASKRALAIDAESLESHKNLAIIYLKTRRFNESLPHWQKVIELEPENPYNYSDFGYVYLMLGKNQKALEAFSKAIQLKPDFADAYYNRSFVYNRLGDKTHALADALQGKKLGAKIPDSYINRLK